LAKNAVFKKSSKRGPSLGRTRPRGLIRRGLLRSGLRIGEAVLVDVDDAIDSVRPDNFVDQRHRSALTASFDWLHLLRCPHRFSIGMSCRRGFEISALALAGTRSLPGEMIWPRVGVIPQNENGPSTFSTVSPA